MPCYEILYLTFWSACRAVANLSRLQQLIHELFPIILSMIVTIDCDVFNKDDPDNIVQALLQCVPNLALKVEAGSHHWYDNGCKQLVSPSFMILTVTRSSRLKTLRISGDVEVTLIMEIFFEVHSGKRVYTRARA